MLSISPTISATKPYKTTQSEFSKVLKKEIAKEVEEKKVTVPSSDDNFLNVLV
jgi:hypothetical protein